MLGIAPRPITLFALLLSWVSYGAATQQDGRKVTPSASLITARKHRPSVTDVSDVNGGVNPNKRGSPRRHSRHGGPAGASVMQKARGDAESPMIDIVLLPHSHQVCSYFQTHSSRASLTRGSGMHATSSTIPMESVHPIVYASDTLIITCLRSRT